MSKIFEWDAQDGSYIARTGQIGVPSTVKLNRFDSGIQLTNDNTGALNFNHQKSFGGIQKFTIILTGNISNSEPSSFGSGFGMYIGSFPAVNGLSIYYRRTGGNTALSLVDNSTTYVINTVSPYTYKLGMKLFYVVSFDGSQPTSNRVKIRINDSIPALSIPSNLPNTIPLLVNNVIGLGSSGLNVVKKSRTSQCIIYDESINVSSKLINELYAKFLQRRPIQIPTSNFNYPKPTLIKDNGLVAAYNFKPVNGKVINIASPSLANGGNPVQFNFTSYKNFTAVKDGLKVLKGLGTADFNTQINLGRVWSICLTNTLPTNWILSQNGSPAQVLTWSVYNYAGNNVSIGATTITPFKTLTWIRTGLSIKLYRDGVVIGSSSLTTDHETIFNRIGRDSTNLGTSGIFSDLRMYNRALSDQEIKSYHNSFTSKPVLLEDFSQYHVGSSPRMWHAKPNTKIEQLLTSNTYLNKGTKVIANNTVLEQFYTQSNQAYGEWLFYMYIPTLNSQFALKFIDDISNAYSIGTNPSGRLVFRKLGVDIKVDTAASTVGWRKFQILRRTDNSFTIYVDNVLWTKVTDATVTNCKRISTSLGTVGFKLANLIVYPGVKV